MLILNPNDLITPSGHFTWREYAYLHLWERMANPTTEQKDNAITLFTHLEQFIRGPLGQALVISSGARTDEYTAFLRSKHIPAALKSAHNEWQAVDLVRPAGMTNSQFWHFCDARWPGRMELLQYTPQWVHLDIREWGSKRRFIP